MSINSDSDFDMAATVATYLAIVWSQLSALSIKNAPLCSFCLANNHPSTKCPEVPPQLHEMLSNTGEPNLPSISRHSWCYPSSLRGRWSRPKYGSTLISFLINASNMHFLLDRKAPLPKDVLLKPLQYWGSQKCQCKVERTITFAHRTAHSLMLDRMRCKATHLSQLVRRRVALHLFNQK